MRDETNNKEEHILWLDGLRGIACTLVFMHHFILAFFPAAYYGIETESSLNKIDTLLAKSTIGIIFNGNFWVCIFCIVSGFVLSLKIMNKRNRGSISESILKRYPRLVLPMFFISFLVYFMLKMGLFSNLEAASYTKSEWLSGYYLETVSIKKVITCSLYSVWFEGDSTFSTAFWMMTPLFMGSFLTYLIGVVTWNANRYIYIVYAMIAIFTLKKNSLLFCFVVGSLLAYIYYNSKKMMENHVLGILLLILGIYFGGYPSNASPLDYYSILAGKLPENINAGQFYHMIGASLFIYGIFCLKLGKMILENKIFLRLGKISFAIYLLHIPILFSVTTKIFLILYKTTKHYFVSAGVGLCVSGILLIIVAGLFNKYVEKWCGKITDKIVNMIYR